MTKQTWIAVRMLIVMTVVTGVLYPLAVTGAAQALFSRQANGSVVTSAGSHVGSSLIGQTFTSDRYLWGRPSATAPTPYNAAASGASNLGPSNPALADAVKERIARLRAADPTQTGAVPADLVTASGSGLDPEISLAAAQFQTARIARVRATTAQAIDAAIGQCTVAPFLGMIGTARVNVLCVNLALDGRPRAE